MNSPFANIFLAMQQRIQSTVPAIKHIDQELGQLKPDKANTRPSISWPCVLIDFEDFSFDNLGTNTQTAEGIVVLRLGFSPYSNSTQSTPDTYRSKALEYYDIEWALHKAMQGWRPGNEFGYLIRTRATTLIRIDSLRVRELRYRIAFEDYSTKPQQLYTGATIVPLPAIEIPL